MHGMVGVYVAQVPMGAGGRGDHPPRRPNFVPAAAPSLARVEPSLPTEEAPMTFNSAACAYLFPSTSTSPRRPNPQLTTAHLPARTELLTTTPTRTQARNSTWHLSNSPPLPFSHPEVDAGWRARLTAINLEAEGSKQLRFVHLTPAQGIVTARIFTQGSQLRVTVTADLDVPLVRPSVVPRPSRTLNPPPAVFSQKTS
jgi:hypothetical protein